MPVFLEGSVKGCLAYKSGDLDGTRCEWYRLG